MTTPQDTTDSHIRADLAADLFAALHFEAAEWADDEEYAWVDRLYDIAPADALTQLEQCSCLPQKLAEAVPPVLRYLAPHIYDTTSTKPTEPTMPDTSPAREITVNSSTTTASLALPGSGQYRRALRRLWLDRTAGTDALPYWAVLTEAVSLLTEPGAPLADTTSPELVTAARTALAVARRLADETRAVEVEGERHVPTLCTEDEMDAVRQVVIAAGPWWNSQAASTATPRPFDEAIRELTRDDPEMEALTTDEFGPFVPIRIVAVPVAGEPHLLTRPVAGLGEVVGGLLESVTLDPDRGLALYCNEAGKSLNLPVNGVATELIEHWRPGFKEYDRLCGDALIVGGDNDGGDADVYDDVVETATTVWKRWVAGIS